MRVGGGLVVLLFLACIPRSSDAALPGSQQWRLTLLNECVGYGCSTLQALDFSTWSLCTVSTTANSGAGSLRACAEAVGSTKSWIIFSVSGAQTITLSTEIQVTANKVIDGRGANITIATRGLTVGNWNNLPVKPQAPNVIVAYLKFATIAGNCSLKFGESAIGPSWVHHNTFGDGLDENLYVGSDGSDGGFVDPPNNITVSYNHWLVQNVGYAGHGFLVSDPSLASVDGNIHISQHHNWFESQIRTPFVRNAFVHSYNNYVKPTDPVGNDVVATQAVTGAKYRSENDIFDLETSYPAVMCTCAVPTPCEADTAAFSASVTGYLLMAGQTPQQCNPGGIFTPPYSYTLSTANAALRTALIAQTGWQAVSVVLLDSPTNLRRAQP